MQLWRVVLKQKVWKLHKQADFFISVQVSDTTKDEERRNDDDKKRHENLRLANKLKT
jgi:hypothetical protein